MDPNTQPPNTQVTQPPQPQVAQPIPVGNVAQAPIAPAPKSNKKMMLFLILLLVVALVVAGGAYFYLMGNKTANTNKQTYAPTPTVASTPSPTPEVSVKNSTQLDSAIKEVNGTSTTTMESEYNQAVTESKSL